MKYTTVFCAVSLLIYSGVTRANTATPDPAPVEVKANAVNSVGQFAKLRDLVLVVLSRHPELNKAEFENQYFDAKLKEARSARLPQVSIGGNLGQESQKVEITNRTNNFDNQYNAQLRGSVPLLDRTIVERVRQSRALSLGQDWQVVTVREQLILNAIEYYTEVVRQHQLTALARENLRTHRTYVSRMKDLARTDVGRASDLPFAEARVALAESVYTNRLARLEAARVQWRNFSGLPAPEFSSPQEVEWILGDLGSIAPPQTLDEAVTNALETNPQLQKALADVKANWHVLQQSRAATEPKLSAEARTQSANDYAGIKGGQSGWFAGLNLQWNLPVNPGYAYSNRAARQSMLASESAVDSVVYRIRSAVESQWYELLASQASLATFQSYAGSARQVVDSYNEQFKIGKRSLLDVLNAENELFTARSNVTTTQIDLILSSWRLLSQRGLVAVELGI